MEWTKYTTKEALKDNDELMILDKDANANKRTLLDKVWNYVVDKMTTAVIAKLGTTNKTLIGAVNELNSKSVVACSDGWKNLNGVSIYKYYSPYSPTVIDSVYGAADIPDTLEPFITVLKSFERLYVTDGKHGIYVMISSSGEWQRKWLKF